MLVTIGVVDATDGRPIFASSSDPWKWVGSLFTCELMSPFLFQQRTSSVGSMLENFRYQINLLPDVNQGIGKPVKLSPKLVVLLLVFAFSWLDHQSAWSREGHSRGVESIVHQSFSNILFGNACLLLYGPDVHNELMPAISLITDVKDLVVWSESMHQIVCIENSECSRSSKLG
jgi:hypothetical protein